MLAAVAAGGALGSLARWGVGTAVAGPLGTVLVNVTGCLLIGVLVARYRDAVLPRAFLGTGVLGGYTTFSAASTDALDLLRSGDAVPAGLYVLGVLALCAGATAAGLRAGRPRSVR